MSGHCDEQRRLKADDKDGSHSTSSDDDNSSEDTIGDDVLAAHLIEDPISLVSSLETYESKTGVSFVCKHFRARNLSPTLLHWVLGLMERNMQSLYEESADGWDADDKRLEMTGTESRYLIAFQNENPVAFSHFQFDMDYGRQVLYCYEIQLEPAVKSDGLGRHIMLTLEEIAKACKLERVVLTTFRFNVDAKKFYAKLGFQIDETSPSKRERKDYLILSKATKST